MRVLGIDPGFGRCGVAVVEKKNNIDTILYSGCIETSPKKSFIERLAEVAQEVKHLLDDYTPDAVAIEEVYFSKNQKTVFHVAEIRGMLLYLSISSHLPVYEYNPVRVKIAMTGYGRANKEQVMTMVNKIFRPTHTIVFDDEYDAIAVAATHLAEARNPENTHI